MTIGYQHQTYGEGIYRHLSIRLWDGEVKDAAKQLEKYATAESVEELKGIVEANTARGVSPRQRTKYFARRKYDAVTVSFQTDIDRKPEDHTGGSLWYACRLTVDLDGPTELAKAVINSKAQTPEALAAWLASKKAVQIDTGSDWCLIDACDTLADACKTYHWAD